MRTQKRIIVSSVLTIVMVASTAQAFLGAKNGVLTTYADIATANYTDALNDAKTLQVALKGFTNNPTAATMANAKATWLNARESYGQIEVFRLSNGPIDAEEGWHTAYGAPEGQLNAWPLDENMIDYTTDTKGKRTSGNIIDAKGSFTPSGNKSVTVNVSNITPDALAALNENGGDANVATGYHAIEFLLWGQDQDYANFMKDGVTNGALTAGQRPVADYTTAKNANRRKQYLNAASALIVSDLEAMTAAWADGDDSNYKAALLGNNADSAKNIDEKTALSQIFAGMGVFIKSELANERIAVAVLTPSEEDEHSCFSDNTHRDITQNYQGFKNILFGTYNGVDYGVAPIDALKDKSKLMALIKSADAKVNQMNALARTSRHFDYQIRPNDSQAKQIKKLKNELRAIGDQMINVAKANGVNLSIGDVTDGEETQL
ncbi:Iron-regulated protein A precursor [uncultured Gammaproteobacteria bacterium]|uniref:imelysin family protein n=1 Tax=Bathymodiolus heckerae thiotrophic gill symbiont TaxID=1052212 RepID=UPI0010AFFBB3|nr:imelysin family protein [Bathymodiolus heckerae thiotrophic gill symbiont]CAC9448117.1 Iron-regulated protein A precursor [uncultured Gammaproteobacteria bacterium]SMN12785.1 Iron-regulated protein A precursor [Bathymodiolus heckerae thiotrophic gill symbiont]SMN16643.1 Iron-regulated protein A precursor [uncultured Candidatus Thioglobus sp.]